MTNRQLAISVRDEARAGHNARNTDNAANASKNRQDALKYDAAKFAAIDGLAVLAEINGRIEDVFQLHRTTVQLLWHWAG